MPPSFWLSPSPIKGFQMRGDFSSMDRLRITSLTSQHFKWRRLAISFSFWTAILIFGWIKHLLLTKLKSCEWKQGNMFSFPVRQISISTFFFFFFFWTLCTNIPTYHLCLPRPYLSLMCAFVYTMFSPLVDMAIFCVSYPVPHFILFYFFHFKLSHHSSPGNSQHCLYSCVVFRCIGRGWFILHLKCFQCSGTIWHRCEFIYKIRGWHLWFLRALLEFGFCTESKWWRSRTVERREGVCLVGVPCGRQTRHFPPS